MKILIEESVLRQALEVLEAEVDCRYTKSETIASLRTAIEQMEKVAPMAWGQSDACGNIVDTITKLDKEGDTTRWASQYPIPLYTAPAVPECMVPLRLEFEPGYPEDVAFGTQRQMDRLKQWLDKYFAMLQAPAVPEVKP